MPSQYFSYYFAILTASSSFTEINFEESSEPSVTPYKICARDIVSRLCVTTINCDDCESVSIISPYFLLLASSNAASVSSNTKNGGGLTCDNANSNAIDVNDRSPPDNISKSLTFLRGNATLISIPISFSPASSSSASSIPSSSSAAFRLRFSQAISS